MKNSRIPSKFSGSEVENRSFVIYETFGEGDQDEQLNLHKTVTTQPEETISIVIITKIQ